MHANKVSAINGYYVGRKGHEVSIIDEYGNFTNYTNQDGINYYVDANSGLDANDGLSWGTSKKTLASAIIASNITIVTSTKGTGRGWAARNTIFYKGDNAEAAAETLITLPNKCDVIGVGSYDHRPYPVLIGNHVIGAGAYMGTRFINMGFLSPAIGGVIMTVPTTTSGLAFLNCHFDGRSSTAATIAILGTAIEQFTIKGCRFAGRYSTATISIGAGSSRMLLIKDNIIESGAIGITINASMTCADADAMILDNKIDAVTLIIQDLSDKCMVSGNRGHTDSNGSLDETFDTNALLSSDNIFACSAGTQSYYPAFAAIPA